MKILKIVFGTLLIGTLFSCNNDRKPAEDAVAAVEEVAALELKEPSAPDRSAADYAENPKHENGEDVHNTERTQAQNNVPFNKKKIIKDGSITIESSNIAESKKRIDVVLKTLNAYYDNENLSNYPRRISYDLIIRIPAENFEKLISSLENGKDEIRNKSIAARDVTEEYVDIETRLSNKREYLKRYKELLTKAITVKDIIALEENIRGLQEEIESKEGRLKYLNDQIAYSTLNINIYQEKEYAYKPELQDSFFERTKRSLNEGWTSIVDFVLWAFSKWSCILLITVIFFIVKRVRRNKK